MEATKKYPISKARDQFRRLFDIVADKNQIIEITVRGMDSTALMVPKRYEVITNKNAGYHEKLPVLIAEFLLPKSQTDFIQAQIADLKKLKLNQLVALLDVKELPLEKETRDQILTIIDEEFIDRLEQRYKISTSVQEAEDLGLYEANEHFASDLPW